MTLSGIVTVIKGTCPNCPAACPKCHCELTGVPNYKLFCLREGDGPPICDACGAGINVVQQIPADDCFIFVNGERFDISASHPGQAPGFRFRNGKMEDLPVSQ